jgi:three-Cys-motif partner protein
VESSSQASDLNTDEEAGMADAGDSAEQAAQALPKGLKPEQYEWDDDGHPREIVGAWSALHKHTLLRRYVDISGVGVRRKWLTNGNAGATYIDLFSGPARARNKAAGAICDGSPLVAWSQAQASKAPFTRMFVADAHPALATAAEIRLRAVSAPAEVFIGEAATTVDAIISRLNPEALHFAFLDPFKLGALPFDVVRKLAAFKRMDILIHISAFDLNRNLRRYISKAHSPIDVFAPGWRQHVGDVDRPDRYIRARILEHWRTLLRSVDMDTAEVHELVTGDANQPLYWLAFVARHPRALDFWEKIRDLEPDPQPSLI